MTRKSIENGIIHTVNGVDTKTGAMYTRQVREFTPESNGFNAELANYVFDQISLRRWLWDQNSWRRILDWDDLDQEEIAMQKQLINFEEDMENPVCGTAMCLAGWVGEVTAGDFVVDSQFLTRAYSKNQDGTYNQEGVELRWALDDDDMPTYLLMPWSEVPVPSAAGIFYWYDSEHPFLENLDEGVRPYPISPAIVAYLEERGFTSDTHALISVAAYAFLKLGFSAGSRTDCDPLNIFDGGNMLERLRAAIDIYTAYGPFLTDADAEVMDAWERSDYNLVRELLGLEPWYDLTDDRVLDA